MNNYLNALVSGRTSGKFAIVVRLTVLTLGWLVTASNSYAVEEDARRTTTVRAVETSLPSVVNIQTEVLVERRDFFSEFFHEFYRPYRELRPSLGSGVFIDDDGYILTNAHVVNRATRIQVVLHDGRVYEAEVFGEDPRSDIALIQLIRKNDDEKFPAIQFAAADDLLLGEMVIALGNPFGLGSSISQGILSSKNRRPKIEGTVLNMADWLQTDAAINPGNSGGPLVNLNGEMIGLNVAIYKNAQGIGFAVPVKQIAKALSNILEASTGLWFGAKIELVGKILKVTEVRSGTPSEQGGLQVGDRIVSIDGQPVGTLVDCYRELIEVRNATANFSVSRYGRKKSLEIEMIPEEEFFNEELIHQRLGVALQSLTPQLRRRHGLPRISGFLVGDVDPDTPAAAARLRAGDIVALFDGREVLTIFEAAKLIDAKEAGQSLTLRVFSPRSQNLVIAQDFRIVLE